MNNCGNCKFWGEKIDEDQEYKWCKRILDGSSISVTVFEQKIKEELAYTMDGDDYQSALITKAEFGCVLWEENK